MTTATEQRHRVRVISYSEIDSALTCQARHAFQYTGHLTGGETLKARETPPILSEGRAWGAAVAAWHSSSDDSMLAGWSAHVELAKSLGRDAAAMEKAGLPPRPIEQRDMGERLGAMLDHYIATAVPLSNLTRLEEPFEVGIPSRTGRQASSRFRFSGRIDGATDDNGNLWLVEFKLRRRLTDPLLLERQRQVRWYAWAYAQKKGKKPVGVIVDERLNEEPHAPRMVKSRKKGESLVPSHAKDQLCTPESYVELCHAHDELPRHDVVEHLRSREWQRRFVILFREGELEEAGTELVSAARLISELDGGALSPVRNAKGANCNGCRFRDICSNPDDRLLVDSMFERTIPKRLRDKEEEA